MTIGCATCNLGLFAAAALNDAFVNAVSVNQYLRIKSRTCFPTAFSLLNALQRASARMRAETLQRRSPLRCESLAAALPVEWSKKSLGSDTLAIFPTASGPGGCRPLTRAP